MSIRMPTGSSLERAMTCTGVVTLPHVSNINDAASSGTTIHDFHYWARKEGVEAAWQKAGTQSDEMTKKLKQFELQLTKIPLPPNYVGELALVYNIESDSARVVGEFVGRQYGELSEGEIALSLDITGVDGGKSCIFDVKTGFLTVTQPFNNWQLRVGALAHTRAFGTTSAEVGITKTSGLYPYTETATFDAMDLDGFAEELKLALARWRGQPRFTTGAHCGYCPALASCPAQVGLIKAVLGSKSANLDVEDWSEAYSTLKALKAATKHLEESIKFQAAREPIALKNGLHYGVAGNGNMKEFKK